MREACTFGGEQLLQYHFSWWRWEMGGDEGDEPIGSYVGG